MKAIQPEDEVSYWAWSWSKPSVIATEIGVIDNDDYDSFMEQVMALEWGLE